jgi:GAF domain-containing protein
VTAIWSEGPVTGYEEGMEPISESLEASNELEPNDDDGDLLNRLTTMAGKAREVAPECIGVSVAARVEGVTFTLVASAEEIAELDAVQYLEGGPCVDAVENAYGIARSVAGDDPLSESLWQAFSQASAAAGVRSTLSLPVMEEGRAVGSVNLYGGSLDAFDGRHEALAEVFGAWAPGAVANADLSFSTRRVAEEAPRRLRESARVAAATGIVAAAHRVDVETAKQRLLDAAQRAGVTLLALAEVVIELGHA